MQDHDQRLKNLIKTFFEEFLLLFFASWAERLDCSKVEWIDKELFLDAPQGSRKILDLVAKLPARQGVPGYAAGENDTWLALVHIEIESADKAAPVRPRMYRSYVALRDEYGLPVLPIGLFLQVKLKGIGIDVYEERFWELKPIRFEYLYVGLPGLKAVDYLEKDNWLGVALTALMEIPPEQAAWLGAEALRRIQSAPLSDQKKYLLGECVEAYLTLDKAQKQEFDALLVTENYAGARVMNQSSFEKGIEKGRRVVLREQLEDKFGALPTGVEAALEKLPLGEVIRLSKVVMHAQSLSDLGLEG